MQSAFVTNSTAKILQRLSLERKCSLSWKAVWTAEAPNTTGWATTAPTISQGLKRSGWSHPPAQASIPASRPCGQQSPPSPSASTSMTSSKSTLVLCQDDYSTGSNESKIIADKNNTLPNKTNSLSIQQHNNSKT